MFHSAAVLSDSTPGEPATLPGMSTAPPMIQIESMREASEGSRPSAVATFVRGPSVRSRVPASSAKMSASSVTTSPTGCRVESGSSRPPARSARSRKPGGKAWSPAVGASGPHATGISGASSQSRSPKTNSQAGPAPCFAGAGHRDGGDLDRWRRDQESDGHEVVGRDVRVDYELHRLGGRRGARQRVDGWRMRGRHIRRGWRRPLHIHAAESSRAYRSRGYPDAPFSRRLRGWLVQP